MTVGNMRRHAVRAAVPVACLALIAGIVGATSIAAESAVSPPQTIKSPDGQLTLTVPKGALAKPAKIRIRVVKRNPTPAGPGTARLARGARVYSLEPDGLRFKKPIIVTRRIPLRSIGYSVAKGVPVPVVATRDSKGRWEPLKATVATRGASLEIAARMRHFSELAFGARASLATSIEPRLVSRSVGDTFSATLRVSTGAGNDVVVSGVHPEVLSRALKVAPGNRPVARLPNGLTAEGQFRCVKEGDGLYGFELKVVDLSIATLVAQFFPGRAPLFVGPSRAESIVRVWGEATCTAKAAPPPPSAPGSELLGDLQISHGKIATTGGVAQARICVSVTTLPSGHIQITFTRQGSSTPFPPLSVVAGSSGKVNVRTNVPVDEPTTPYDVRVKATKGTQSQTETRTVKISAATSSSSCS